MLDLLVKDVERECKVRIKSGLTAFGADCASRTGWAKATSNGKTIHFDYGFVDIATSERYFRFNQFIDICTSLVTSDLHVVVEESYFGRNARAFQLLSRLGIIVYMIAYQKQCPSIQFLTAAQARMKLSFKGIAKKQLVQADFLKRFNLQLKDEDIIDAMILAMCGLVE